MRRHACRLGVVYFLDEEARPLGDRLVLGPAGDAVEELAPRRFFARRRRRTLEGADSRFLVIRSRRDIGELGGIVDADHCRKRDLGLDGVPGNAGQHLRVLNLAQRRRPDCRVRRGLGDGAEMLLVAEAFEGRRRVGVSGRGGVGDRHQPVGEVAPQRFVALGPRDPRQVPDGSEAFNRRPSHPNVLVRRCELCDHAPALGIVWQFGDAGEPHGGIGVAVFGCGLEAIQERHGEPYFNRDERGPIAAGRAFTLVRISRSILVSATRRFPRASSDGRR